MKNLSLLIALLILFQVSASSQVDSTIIDLRNGRNYRAQLVGNTYWFKENLDFPAASKLVLDSITLESHQFYSRDNLKNACPEGWRLPTPDDWTHAYSYFIKSATDSNRVYIDSVPVSATVSLLNDSTFLDIKPVGWIQGEDWEEAGNLATFWIDFDKNRGHLHIRKNNFTLHTHHHHLSGVFKNRQRMFSVRCVMDKK